MTSSCMIERKEFCRDCTDLTYMGDILYLFALDIRGDFKWLEIDFNSIFFKFQNNVLIYHFLIKN